MIRGLITRAVFVGTVASVLGCSLGTPDSFPLGADPRYYQSKRVYQTIVFMSAADPHYRVPKFDSRHPPEWAVDSHVFASKVGFPLDEEFKKAIAGSRVYWVPASIAGKPLDSLPHSAAILEACDYDASGPDCQWLKSGRFVHSFELK